MSNNAASAQPYPGFVVLRSGGAVRLATLGRRFLARVVDVGILLVVSVPLLWQLVGALDSRTVRPESARASIGGAAFIRGVIPAAASYVCGPFALLCHLSVLFDGSGRRQAWHDQAASSLVISTLERDQPATLG